MIIKFEQYNEGIKHLLVGPTEDEVLDGIKNKHWSDILEISLNAGILKGVKKVFSQFVDINKEYREFSIDYGYSFNKRNSYLHTDVIKYLDSYNLLRDWELRELLSDSIKSNDGVDTFDYICSSHPKIKEEFKLKMNKHFLLTPILKGYKKLIYSLLKNGFYDNNKEYYFNKLISYKQEDIAELFLESKQMFKEFNVDEMFELNKFSKFSNGYTFEYVYDNWENIKNKKDHSIKSIKYNLKQLQDGKDIGALVLDMTEKYPIMDGNHRIVSLKLNGNKTWYYVDSDGVNYANPPVYKNINEGINHLLVGPTKEEIWKNLGYDRTFHTPEDFLKELSKDMKTNILNSNELEFYKNDEGLFIYEIKEQCLSVSYSVQKLILDMFDVDKETIEKIIKNVFIEIIGHNDFEVALYQNEFNTYD